jgi:hypothetical protein
MNRTEDRADPWLSIAACAAAITRGSLDSPR